MKEGLITAKNKYTRTSPKKMAIVLDLIRGKKYLEAERILAFTPNKTAKLALKTLKSAGANASHNKGIKEANLKVTVAFAGAGPILKRMRAQSRGRSTPILKRTSHIIISLEEVK